MSTVNPAITAPTITGNKAKKPASSSGDNKTANLANRTIKKGVRINSKNESLNSRTPIKRVPRNPILKKRATSNTATTKTTNTPTSINPNLNALTAANAIGLSVSESEKLNEINDMTQIQSDNCYVYETTCDWRGKRWKFKLNVPLNQPYANLSKTERDELRSAVDKARKIFLEDLKTKDEPRKFGSTDFNFEFTDKGYNAFIPTDKYNEDLSLEDNIQVGGCVDGLIEGDDESADKISKLIRSGEANDVKTLVKTINEQIERDSTLSKLYKSAQTQKSTQSTPVPFSPVGFKNLGNTCYLNTALQSLASNPIIREELLKPGVIRDGENHPLYVALKAYEEAQHAPTNKPIDLTALRNLFVERGYIEEGAQEDPDELMRNIRNELNLTSDSKLYHTYLTRLGYTDSSNSLAWVDSNSTQNAMLAQKTIFIKSGKTFVELLGERDSLETPKKMAVLNGSGSTEVDCTLGQDGFKGDPNVISVRANRYLTNGLSETKDFTKIDVPLEATFPGELFGKKAGVPYELMSFAHHEGTQTNSGHYVTYVKNGDAFFAISDATPPIKIDKNEFLDKAKTAYYYIFNKKGLTAASSNTSNTASSGEPLSELISTKHHNSEIAVGVGDITTRSGATIVNFTNRTLDKETLIAKAANITTEEFQAKLRENAGFFNKNGYFEPGEVASTNAGNLQANGVNKIIHAVIPEMAYSTPLSEEDKTRLVKDLNQVSKAVTNALEMAQKNKQKTIAFSLLDETPSDLNRTIYGFIKDSIDQYVEKHKDDIDPPALRKIEIVLSPAQRKRIKPANSSSSTSTAVKPPANTVTTTTPPTVTPIINNIAAPFVNPTPPAGYEKRENYEFLYHINNGLFIVEADTRAEQPATNRADPSGGIATHLNNIATPEKPYSTYDGHVIDLRPGNQIDPSIVNHSLFCLSHFGDARPQAALETLLGQMANFTNPLRKKIRIILPKSLNTETNKAKIKATLDLISPKIPAAVDNTSTVSTVMSTIANAVTHPVNTGIAATKAVRNAALDPQGTSKAALAGAWNGLRKLKFW